MRRLRYAALLVPLAFTACASIERSCHGDTCFLRASPAQVDRQCRKGATTWDNGEPVAAGGTFRCCTELPNIYANRERYRVWVGRGQEDCVPHEHCHIEEHRMDRHEHWRCHGKGWGLDRTRKPITSGAEKDRRK